MNSRKATVLIAILLAVCIPLTAVEIDSSTPVDFPSDISIDVVDREITNDRISVSLDAGYSKTLYLSIISTKTDGNPYVIAVHGTSGMVATSVPDATQNELVSGKPYYLAVNINADREANEQVYVTSIHVKGYDPDKEVHFQKEIYFDVDVHSAFYSEGMYNKIFGVYENPFPAPLNIPEFAALATLFFWVLASVILGFVVLPYVNVLVEGRYPNSKLDESQISTIRMIFAVMIFTGLGQCMQIVGADAAYIHIYDTWSNVIYVCIGAVIAWNVWKAVVNVLARILDDTVDIEGADSSLVPLFKMIGEILIAVVSVAIILSSFGVDLGGILVSAGVVSLGITLGAQNILGQFFSGIVLLSTRPFKKGDFVKINGNVYTVMRVKLMFTEFKNWDGDQIITIPNNTVTAATVVNLTRDSKDTRIFIYMSVAYEANLTLAKELMLKAAMMHPHVIKDGSRIMPGTRLTNFLDSGIEYRLSCYVDDFDNSSHYAGQIREIMYKLFVDNNVEIPYNKMEVYVHGECDGKRRADDKTDDTVAD